MNVAIDASQKMTAFKSLLSDLATVHETLWIEKEVYRRWIEEREAASLEGINCKVVEALSNSDVRRQAHENYSELWVSLSESGLTFLIDLLLQDVRVPCRVN